MSSIISYTRTHSPSDPPNRPSTLKRSIKWRNPQSGSGPGSPTWVKRCPISPTCSDGRTKDNVPDQQHHREPARNRNSAPCPDCNKVYVGQTGGRFPIRYNEHDKSFYNYSHTSSFAQHLHEQAHSFGLVDNFKQVIHHHKKGAHLNTVERFYIYADYVANNHLNDNHSVFPSKIFDNLLKTHRP